MTDGIHSKEPASAGSLLTIFSPQQPEYTPKRLRCRFVIGAGHTSEQLAKEKLKAGYRFISDMKRQGWEWQGAMALVGGPYPAVTRATGVPKKPSRGQPKRGEHHRFTSVDAYKSPVADVPTLLTTSDWEYELAGVFVRKLMPIEILA